MVTGMIEPYEHTHIDIRQLTPPINATKIGRVLQRLGVGEVLNNRAAFVIGDTCLHSTISALRNDHDMDITGEPEKYKGHDGHLSQRHRYWINPDPIILRSVYRLLKMWGWTDSTKGQPILISRLNRAA